MKRLQLSQLIKSVAAFAGVSAATMDAWLFVLDAGGYVHVPPEWFISAPVFAWGVVGIPASIALGERLITTARAAQKPGKIHAIEVLAAEDSAGGVRAIPFTQNGYQKTLFASAMRWAIGDAPPQSAPPRRIVTAWRVPVADDYVTISERELSRFLELASRRTKYQFSRRYWTERRRPPMPRPRYEAIMSLLTSAGLIEARCAGASGWLIGGIKPHNAVTYLKYESLYSLPG